MPTSCMRIILLTLFLSIHVWAHGQYQFPGFAIYNSSNMDFRINSVISVYEDPIGYLWFCTTGGLDRWDGNNLKHYPNDLLNPRALPESLQASIIMDKTGKYWINTHSCLSVLDTRLPIDSAVTRIFRAPNNPNIPLLHGTTGAPIVSDEHGNFWLAWYSQGGVLFIIPDKLHFDFKKIRCEDGGEDMLVSSIEPDSTNHRMWLITPKQAFCSIGTTNFEVIHYESAVKHALMELWQETDDILGRTSFCWSKRGFFWCISEGKPVTQFHVKTRKATFFECENPIYTGQFNKGYTTHYEDYRGNCWINNPDSGVLLIDVTARKCILFKHIDGNPSSLGGHKMNYITGDRQGNIWFAHQGAGVSKFNYNLKHPFWTKPLGPPPPSDLAYNTPIEITADNEGNEYLQANSGFFIKPNGQEQFQKISKFTEANYFFSGEDGSRYTITYEGVFKFSANPVGYNKLAATPSMQAFEAFKSMSAWLYDKSQGEPVLWLSCPDKGLLKYFLEKGTTELVNSDTIIYGKSPTTAVGQIQLDSKNNLWFRLNQGFAKFNPTTHEWTKWMHNAEDINFIAVPPYLNMMVDSKDRVWFASLTGGAVWFDGVKFHSASTLVSGTYYRCFTVAEGKNGEIWFTTKKNTVRFVPETGRYKVYEKINDVVKIAFKNDSTAILVRGDQLIYVPIEDLDSKKTTPKTIISGFHIFETDRSELLNQSEIVLHHDQNYLTFEFGSLDFISLDGGRFAWKLSGADKNWVEPKDNRSFASYSTLPPGKYTFHVKSCNADGIWDTKGASVTVTILPPWYQTWWLRLLYLTAAAALVWWFFQQNTLRKLAAQRAEIQQQQALERERERIARDMHDDLGSGLSAIHLLSTFAKDRASDPAIQSEMEKIAESSANLNQNIREIIWTVNSADDTLSSLAHFLRKYCADFQENTKLTLRFEAPDLLPDMMLSGEVRRHLFLCVKEALNNTAKYSNAQRAIVKLEVKDTRVAISVHDDGKGFDVRAAMQNGGNGLKNMQLRMQQIGGKATATSSTEGTKWLFETEV